MPQYCPSVCPSVTFSYPDHICWNTSKMISPPNSDTIVMWLFLRNRRLILRLHTIFRAVIYWAHRGVIFAIAWFSCCCFYSVASTGINPGFNPWRYIVVMKNKHWHGALRFCNDHHAKLVSIGSGYEQHDLRRLLDIYFYCKFVCCWVAV